MYSEELGLPAENDQKQNNNLQTLHNCILTVIKPAGIFIHLMIPPIPILLFLHPVRHLCAFSK